MDTKKDFIERNKEVKIFKERYPDEDERVQFLSNAWDDFEESEFGREDDGKSITVPTEFRYNKHFDPDQEVESGDWVVIGYATTKEVNSHDSIITLEALEKAQDDLLKENTMLFNHNQNRPIGKIVETHVDSIGLLVKGVISKEEEEIWRKVQEGIINKFSIQGRALDMEPIEGENGEEITKINEIYLFEAGLVSTAGNSGAQTLKSYVA